MGKFGIVMRPNWGFYVISGACVINAVSNGSWTPIWWWCGFVGLSCLLGFIGFWLFKASNL